MFLEKYCLYWMSITVTVLIHPFKLRGFGRAYDRQVLPNLFTNYHLNGHGRCRMTKFVKFHPLSYLCPPEHYSVQILFSAYNRRVTKFIHNLSLYGHLVKHSQSCVTKGRFLVLDRLVN